ncbi:hypothetical protein M0R88_14655 [Halorussus gelatinilyticus]|uniref:Uncharacterized protein n=1 Tax=Halorussus gelatinilyticus TaxID=2937524 RepID=A0A8U0IFT9_9EURY|nr:hypothetical protein [Halorussus gelatinilyticus]UPV99747.1 hypothetical protein M0R88_14655 [Halorussus gelatinilyticus]
MSDLTSFVFIAQTTMLVITSVLLVYPVVAYARNVAHTRGLLLLAAGFLTLTFSYVASVPLGMSLVSSLLDFAASVFAAAGIWQFARPFVRLDGRDVETPTGGDATGGDAAGDDVTGGFESAGDD